MTTDLELYSPDPTLTPDQHHVLALLAEGRSITAAAEAVGIHRNTIRNWRRAVPAFAREIEFAVREQALVWHEQALDLAPKAAAVLEEILNDPAASPSIRLRAALAVLKMAAEPQPKSLRLFPTAAAEMEASHGEMLSWQATQANCAPENTKKPHNPAQSPSSSFASWRLGVKALEAAHREKFETPAQSRTISPVRKAPEPGRNSPCPCGSGQKYKRCCAFASAA
jgi:transposase-like protein